jgi:epidermal growth factor receptor substrate 15
MNRKSLSLAVPIAGLACVMAGCSVKTDVSVTGNSPALYSHVWITAQEVWFNTSANAGPDDGGWVKFSLSTPATVDLVTESGGNLGSLVTGLKLVSGNYSQVRLIPLDASAALASSAQTAGAIYNAEADYVDSGGLTHQLPLEFLSPDKGIGIPGSLSVPIGNIGAALAGATSSTTPTTTRTTTTTTTTTTPTNPATSSNTSTTTASFALAVDGARDLTLFTYGGASSPNGILLSSHAGAYDLAQVSGISGQLTLTNLTGINGNTGLPAIQVSAEVLSADGTRHVVVSSTPVHADGSFMLYPLATTSSNPPKYDVVIHGAGIATIVIKAVQLSPASSSKSSTSGSTTTTGSSATNTVSVGTLIPRSATSSYTVNISNATGPALPAGARVAFYQTLAAQGEVPYLIEASPIDPFNQTLANSQELSGGTIDSGTYNTSGSTVTLVSAAPAEKAGGYLVAASAPGYADGPLTTTVSAPQSGTTAPPVTVPGLALAAGSSAGSISVSITQATAGKYDHGELLLGHDGTLIASAALDTALTQGAGATVTVNGVPSGTGAALYYATVRVWSSTAPSGTLHRQSYAAAIDLRGSTSGSAQLTIN